jgi:hypothetical protein
LCRSRLRSRNKHRHDVAIAVEQDSAQKIKDRPMSSRRLSFTERRRNRLALKFGRLDRLETRNTMTEPISITALSLGAFKGLAQFGVMHADGGKSELLGLTQMAQQARQAAAGARHALAVSKNASLLAIGINLKHAPQAAGGGSATQIASQQKQKSARQSQPVDALSLTSSADANSSEAHGISTPWHPTARAGGGAAMAPRGGSGNGAQAATIALVAGRGGHATTQAPPSAPATIPGYLAPHPYQGPSFLGSSPGVTRNAAARDLVQGGGGSSPSTSAADVAGVGTPTSPVIAENSSLMASSRSSPPAPRA